MIKFKGIMRRDTWEIVSRKSVADHKIYWRKMVFQVQEET